MLLVDNVRTRFAGVEGSQLASPEHVDVLERTESKLGRLRPLKHLLVLIDLVLVGLVSLVDHVKLLESGVLLFTFVGHGRPLR